MYKPPVLTITDMRLAIEYYPTQRKEFHGGDSKRNRTHEFDTDIEEDERFEIVTEAQRDNTYQKTLEMIASMTHEKLREEVAEIVLGIRQHLCNTEFAPEPLREPLDIAEFKKRFTDQILTLISAKIEQAKREERERFP